MTTTAKKQLRIVGINEMPRWIAALPVSEQAAAMKLRADCKAEKNPHQ